ncbi:hypothetical protein P4V82_29580, partial [Bacillus thuringiensis]|nr:hypothetical protein [Bacillus thuringiensis]
MHRKASLPIYNSASYFYIKGGTWYEGFNGAVYQNKKDIRGTASISEKNHAKKIRVKKSENISLFQDTYSVFFYTKNNTTQ